MLPPGFDASFVSQLPVVAQAFLYLLGCLAAAAAMYAGYQKGKVKADQPRPSDVVLTGAAITDMKPVRDAVEEIARLTAECARVAAAAEEMLDVLRKELEERKEREFDELREAKRIHDREVRELRDRLEQERNRNNR